MLLCPSNEAFRSVVREAACAFGRPTPPTSSVAVFPHDIGFKVRLVEFCPHDHRHMKVVRETLAETEDLLAAAIHQLFPQGNRGDEFIFLHEQYCGSAKYRFGWVLISGITTEKVSIGDVVPQSVYN